ncbi:MAG: CAP domain-containing protein [Lactobacillaceae bacterium]|jgi:hypothetical protein|nr:CAP domain-containing protein [Lactobacillaceae bacterium]
MKISSKHKNLILVATLGLALSVQPAATIAHAETAQVETKQVSILEGVQNLINTAKQKNQEAAQAAQQEKEEQAKLAAAGQYASTLQALNQLRASYGLQPLEWDQSLSDTAAYRAQLTNTSGVPADHLTLGTEVIAWGFGLGQPVITEWFTEAGAITNGGTPHRNWELSSKFTKVGFAIVGGTIVGRAA